MYKTGVTSRGAFAERTLQLEREHRIWRPFAYTILEDLQQHYSLADEPLLERIYQSLSAGNTVKKITRRGRFRELDARIAEECRIRFGATESVVIHDVGASNGITSWELFELLARERPVEVHATDYYDRLYLVTLNSTGWTIAFDVNRVPLQAVGGSWVLGLQQPHPWRHPLNRWLQYRVRCKVLPKAKAALEQYVDSGVQESGIRVRELSLFHPQCIQETRREGRFSLSRHNLFQPSPIRSHVARALNVLTTKHLSAEQVMRGIEMVANSLERGGLLILGRSIDEEDGRLRATAYSVDGSNLSELWNLNEGYEDKCLALTATTLDT